MLESKRILHKRLGPCRCTSYTGWATIACLLLILNMAYPAPQRCVAAPSLATKEQINAAIDRGLQYLHVTMTRPDADTGYWDVRYPEATTAMAILAFELQGHHAAGKPDDPYADTVRRGLNYLLRTLRQNPIAAQPGGNPDSNGNGFGLGCSASEAPVYTAGIVLMALVASGTPRVSATVGGDGVLGRTYQDIAQDMVDYLARAQADSPDTARGGWRYRPNDSDGDMSVSQWPVIGMEAAETNWKVAVPAWVKTNLSNFLAVMQDADGGFGYTGSRSRYKTSATTAAGIACLLWTGVPAGDARISRAKDFIAAQWTGSDAWGNPSNLGNFYTMYAVAKASLLARPEITLYGTHDWYEEYSDYLVSAQGADGSWDDEASWASGNYPLATAWALMILSRSIPVRRLPSLPWWWWLIPLALFALLAGLWWWRNRPKPQGPVPPPTKRPKPPVPSEKKKPKETGADITHGRGRRQ